MKEWNGLPTDIIEISSTDQFVNDLQAMTIGTAKHSHYTLQIANYYVAISN